MNRHRSPYQIFNTFVEHIKILRDIFRKESNLNFLNAIKKKISNNIVLCAQARVGMHYIAKYLVNIGYETFYLSPFTNIEIIEAIKFANGKIIFIDLDILDGYPKEIEELLKIDNKKICLILTNLYTDKKSLDTLSIKLQKRNENFKVIEDNAINFGSKFEKKYLGTLFDFGIFSFGKLKKISLIFGGAIYFKDEKFRKYYDNIETQNLHEMPRFYFIKEFIASLKIKILTSAFIYDLFTINIFKITNKYDIQFFKKKIHLALFPTINKKIPINYFYKFPYYLSDFAVGKLLELDKKTYEIHQKVQYYYSKLKDIDYFILPEEDNINHLVNMHTEYPIILKNENNIKILKFLSDRSIFLRFHWYQNLDRFYEYNKLCKPNDADMIQNNCILLPCGESIDKKYQDMVVGNIIKYFEK
jgi:dTDP-4-amino-4,6-dideoxygalactose transaminase